MAPILTAIINGITMCNTSDGLCECKDIMSIGGAALTRLGKKLFHFNTEADKLVTENIKILCK